MINPPVNPKWLELLHTRFKRTPHQFIWYFSQAPLEQRQPAPIYTIPSNKWVHFKTADECRAWFVQKLKEQKRGFKLSTEQMSVPQLATFPIDIPEDEMACSYACGYCSRPHNIDDSFQLHRQAKNTGCVVVAEQLLGRKMPTEPCWMDGLWVIPHPETRHIEAYTHQPCDDSLQKENNNESRSI